jgi:mannose-1-phosphate guanylyltransferase
MKQAVSNSPARCCIVIGNEERSERLTENFRAYALSGQQAAAVKKGFLRQASLRARRIVSPANVLLSAREADRDVWAGPLWFIHAANRFISDPGVPASFSTAAAVLSVAVRSPSCLITVLPSDFWVARESTLTESMEKVLTALRWMPDTVATLGMSDTHPGLDEDYLVVGPENPQTGAAIQAKAHRPAPTIAKQLLKEGALVASGILLGQAQAFASRVHRYWPHAARELTEALDSDRCEGREHRLSAKTYCDISRSVMSSIRLSPPTFPMRAFRVFGSGWCSRKRSNERPAQPEARWRARPMGSTVTTDYPT